jgi:hypothetical protein
MRERLAVIQPPGLPGWRPKLGLLLFILALASPVLSVLVLGTDLPREMRGAVAGLLLFGLPMALMMAIVALIGQPAYTFIRRLVAGRDSSPELVGVGRYRFGLLLLVISVLTSWLEPLLSPHMPVLEARKIPIGTVADGMVLVSLFVLGGAFWDKVHALFVHDAHVVPGTPAAAVAATEAVQVGTRFYVGAAIFLGSLAMWLLVPAASAAGWSASQIASLTGGVFIGTKVGMLAAIAVMGKPGFNHLKRLLLGLFRKVGPPQHVGRERYRLGLLLFLVPVLMTWIAPYAAAILGTTGIYGFLESRALEALLLVGLFLLGGDFWDKLGALFKHRATIEFDTKASPTFAESLSRR